LSPKRGSSQFTFAVEASLKKILYSFFTFSPLTPPLFLGFFGESDFPSEHGV